MLSRSEIAPRGGAWTAALPLLLLWAGLAAGTAGAQPLKEALEDCLAVKHDRARLACFEAVARGEEMPVDAESETTSTPPPTPRPQSVPASSAVSSADTERSAEAPRDRFGLPKVREPDPAEEERREMVIVEARPLPRDKGLFVMDNGQVWTLVSGTFRPVDPGTPVVIEEGWLGSYRMLVEDGWTYRVRRVR